MTNNYLKTRSLFIRHKLLLVTLLFATSMVSAEIFKCQTVDGKTTFSDQPCPENSNSNSYQPQTNITTLKHIADFKPSSTTASKRTSTSSRASNRKSVCQYFSDTEIRNLRVKKQLKNGLTKSDVLRTLGEPARHSTSSTGKETYIYKHEKFTRYVYFKDGCLQSWNEKWHESKSKISKYND